MKVTRLKKLLAATLSAAMVFTMVPSTAFAEEAVAEAVETEAVAEEAVEEETVEVEAAEEEVAETSSDEKEDGTVGNSYTQDKIEVFDFGAKQYDATKYNNWLTADVINSWYSDEQKAAAKTDKSGVTIPGTGFEVKDDAGKVVLKYNPSGATNHRLRSTNSKLYRNDDKGVSGKDGVTYDGYIYSNSNQNPNVKMSVYMNAGDILTGVFTYNNVPSTTVIVDETGAVCDEFIAYQGSLHTFYAPKSGLFSMYSVNDKLCVAHLEVKHPKTIKVTGAFRAPTKLPSDAKLLFTCDQSGAVTEVTPANNAYTANLFGDGYTYKLSLKNANGYVISSDATLATDKNNEDKTLNVKVQSVNLVTVTGKITGISAEDLAKMKVEAVAQDEKIYVPEITIDGTDYTVDYEYGTYYDIKISDLDKTHIVKDYQVVTKDIMFEQDATSNIVFKAVPTYNVTVEAKDSETAEAIALSNFESTTVTLTEVNESGEETGYVYSFTGLDNIKVRDGIYAVKLVGMGEYTAKLISNIKVNGANTTKVIKFVSPEEDPNVVKEYDFTSDAYTGQSEYQGLTITNGKRHGSTYGMTNNNGNITVAIPVVKDSTIDVYVGYTWEITVNDGASNLDNTTEVAIKSTSDAGKNNKLSYNYVGGEGTVTITGGSTTTYISKIVVTPVGYVPPAAKEYIFTVAQDGSAEYSSINDALAAVKELNRGVNDVAVIKIAPGDYEEMLVINQPNVKLVNTATNPSITPIHKGVDIADNSVRITGYYGHGYSYGSMTNKCKYDAELLEVNKENGYPSYTNPGAGNTDGSWWNATVVVDSSATGFTAEGIIFENSFNQYVSKKAADDLVVPQPNNVKEGSVPRAEMKYGDTTVQDKKYVERAAAMAILADKSYFKNCSFIGRQDTLYSHTNVRTVFNKCDIYGGTDYIFGNFSSIFYKCNLVGNTDGASSTDNFYITANKQAQSTGTLLYNCDIISTIPGVNTAATKVSNQGCLGRSWEGDPVVVFYKTNIGKGQSTETASTSLIMEEGFKDGLGGTFGNVYEIASNEKAGVDNSSKRKGSKLVASHIIKDASTAAASLYAFATYINDGTVFTDEWTLPDTLDTATDDVIEVDYATPTTYDKKTITVNNTSEDLTILLKDATEAKASYAVDQYSNCAFTIKAKHAGVYTINGKSKKIAKDETVTEYVTVKDENITLNISFVPATKANLKINATSKLAIKLYDATNNEVEGVSGNYIVDVNKTYKIGITAPASGTYMVNSGARKEIAANTEVVESIAVLENDLSVGILYRQSVVEIPNTDEYPECSHSWVLVNEDENNKYYECELCDENKTEPVQKSGGNEGGESAITPSENKTPAKPLVPGGATLPDGTVLTEAQANEAIADYAKNASTIAAKSKTEEVVTVKAAATDKGQLAVTYKKGKATKVVATSLDGSMTYDVTVNAGVKVVVPGTKEDAGSIDVSEAVKVKAKYNKKAAGVVIATKNSKTAPKYDVVYTNESNGAKITIHVVCVSIAKNYKKYTVSSGNGASVTVTPANGGILTGTWTVGKKVVEKANESVNVQISKKLSADVVVNPNGSITISNPNGKGAIKLTYTINGKKYNTAIKVTNKPLTAKQESNNALAK